ncbi:MAG: hypothetical protein KAS75_00040, partial [Planctomycetes bacterium]|nr:hypothetical protein [Planctomycetota bacterium]
DLYIGMMGGIYQNVVFNGSIDDVCIYNQALSAEQVQEIYLQGFSDYDIAVINIDDAISRKSEIINEITDIITGEQQAYDALESLLESGDYTGLQKGDIVTAKQKVKIAIRKQRNSKRMLRKSIVNLEAALDALGLEPLPEPDPNLVAHWKLDETTGNIASDSAGTNNGTLMGDPTWTTGQIDGALDFDGSGDYIAGSTSPFDFENTTFTVCLWFNKAQPTGVMLSEGSYKGGWQISDGGGTNYGGVKVMIKRKNSTSSAYTSISQDTYDDGLWHHMAAVITTSTTDYLGNSVDIYIDGALIPVFEIMGNYPYGSSDENWRIAARPTDPAYYNGLIDDVRIYDKALSAEEIQQLYNPTETSGNNGKAKGKNK